MNQTSNTFFFHVICVGCMQNSSQLVFSPCTVHDCPCDRLNLRLGETLNSASKGNGKKGYMFSNVDALER